MIDPTNETLIPLLQARDHLPIRVHQSTLRRWAREGSLETLRIAGRIYTSVEATRRLIARSQPQEVIHAN